MRNTLKILSNVSGDLSIFGGGILLPLETEAIPFDTEPAAEDPAVFDDATIALSEVPFAVDATVSGNDECA